MNIRLPRPPVIITAALLVMLLIVPTTSAQAACGTSVTVTYGDTLFGIAQRCGFSVQALLDVNPELTNAARIRIGQTLRIPATDPSQLPLLAVSPLSGPAGTDVVMILNGFPPNTPVTISFGVIDGTAASLFTLNTDANGTLFTRAPIPTYALPGERWVLSAASADGFYNAESYPFTVTNPPPIVVPMQTAPPAATAIPTPAPFTRTSIFLIALDDGGQTGQPVGCNDSLVPVTVDIAPTGAPLSASLQALLNVGSQYYGQSGLYNALYGSALQVQGVNIANGEAIISLSGTVSLGGVCDAPRFRAQLEQTALQFSTVSSVSIFINSEPLDQVLGQ